MGKFHLRNGEGMLTLPAMNKNLVRKDMIGAGDAAKALGVTPRQVRNLIAEGLLVAHKVGRDYVIERADLERVPRNRKRGPRPRNL